MVDAKKVTLEVTLDLSQAPTLRDTDSERVEEYLSNYLQANLDEVEELAAEDLIIF